MTATPDWLLERLAAGDLPATEADALRRRIVAEPGGAARLAELERSNGEILAALPAERVAAEVARRAPLARRARPARRAPFFGLALAGGALAAALVLLVVVRSGTSPGRVDGPEITRVKGDARILVHRRHGESAELLTDGSRAGAGDVIQLSYQAGGARYGALFSVDGRGVVTQHLPEDGRQAAPLGAGPVSLPHAYELDDAPRGERFFFVTSSRPFELAPLLEAAKGLGAGEDASFRRAPLSLPRGLRQVSFFLDKVQP